MRQKTFLFILILSIFTTLFCAPAVLAQSSPILITEVQPGFIDGAGLEYPKQEFVEITNVSSGRVDMTDWRVEYLSASHDGSGAPTSVLLSYTGWLPLNGRALFSHVGYVPGLVDRVFGEGSTSATGLLAKSGGHVRVMNGTTMIDCVAWGSAVAITGCDKITVSQPAGHTIQRPLSESGWYDKLLGLKNLAPPNPSGGDLYDLGPQEPPGEPEPPVVTPWCSNIQLSELLANPAGDDASGEFIEIFNPTDQIQPLLGCSLRLGNAGKQYQFEPGDTLAPGQYKAYYFSSTGLQLTNSGGQVWLVLSDSEQLSTYPNSNDDQAWALIRGVWQITTLPTPNAANSLPEPSLATDVVVAADSEDCPLGKYRNPETGRCKNVESDNEQTPCSAGQERNTETNRCRKTVTASSATVAACDAGQQRNPETNRCRKVTTTETTVKACEVGQERNPETNRCRKVTTANAAGGKPDDTNGKGIQNYRILFIVLLLVAGYAVYEYRQDISNFLNALRSRMFGKSTK